VSTLQPEHGEIELARCVGIDTAAFKLSYNIHREYEALTKLLTKL